MELKKLTGNALIVGCVLLAVTMALHPSGGNLAHLQKIAQINAVAYSIGLIGILFLCFGFISVRNVFREYYALSLAASITVTAGLSAGFLAAIINGIALPVFILQFSDENSEVWHFAKAIIQYGTSLNHAFDFVMEGGVIISILIWSVVIIKSKLISKYVGYIGFSIVSLFVVSLLTGGVLVDLDGMRLFILGFIIWILVLSYSLITLNHNGKQKINLNHKTN